MLPASDILPRGSISSDGILYVDGVRVGVPAPPGYDIDLDNPARRSDVASYAVCGVGIPIATFFLLQRLYVRTYIQRKLSWVDFILIFAWLGTVTIQAMIIHSFVHRYMGLHNFEMPYEKLKMAALLPGYINSIVYQPPSVLAKLVILQFYRDINYVERWFRWAVYFTEAVVVSTGLALFIVSIVPCLPIRKSWDLDFVGESHCLDSTMIFESNAALGVATDLLILLVPIPMVAKLQMSTAKKAGLIAMFAIGGLTTLTSMARLIVLMAAKGNPDRTWVSAPTVLWICVEANFFIICACLSTLRQFLNNVSPKLISKLDSMAKSKQSDSEPPTHELRTFGQSSGSRNRGRYDRFDDVGDTINEIDGGRGKSVSDDERSHKGIIKQSEFRVQVEQGPDGKRSSDENPGSLEF